MALDYTSRGGSTDTVSRSTYDTDEHNHAAGQPWYIFIYNTKATNADSPTSVTLDFGLVTGLSWAATKVVEVTYGASNARRLSLWVAAPTVGTFSLPAGARTRVVFPATQTGFQYRIVQARGGNLLFPNVDANTATTSGTGTSATNTLSALALSTHGHLCGIGHGANENTVPGSGFTEEGDAGFSDGGVDHRLAANWKLNDTTCDPSWSTSSVYGLVSVEGVAALLGDISEAATLADAVTLAWAVLDGETATLAEVVELLMAKAVSEGVTLGDAATVEKFLGAIASESLSLADAITLVVAISQGESVNLAESVRAIGRYDPDEQPIWRPNWLVRVTF